MNIDKNTEQQLRFYVKREISDLLKTKLVGLISSLHIDYKDAYRHIYMNFCQGKLGKAYAYKVIDEIYGDIKSVNKHKNCSPYHYFDLDTLISFKEYLSNLIAEVFRNRNARRARFASVDDFNKALDDSPTWLRENQGSEVSGYYDYYNPVTLLRVDGKLAPERTLSLTEFIKKYPNADSLNKLLEYMEARHPKTQAVSQEVTQEYTPSTISKNIPGNSQIALDIDAPKQTEEQEEDFIVFRGEKYYIDRMQTYFDINFWPVNQIFAHNLNGSKQLIGTFTMDNELYIGDLYDNDGNPVLSKEESGVLITNKNGFGYSKPRFNGVVKNDDVSHGSDGM